MKNKLINYFFDDIEEYEAYKPIIKLLSTLGLINLIVALLCLWLHLKGVIILLGGEIMDVNKERDLKYIKDFSKIKVAAICKDLNVDKSNLWRGNASGEVVKKVKEEIKKRINELGE